MRTFSNKKERQAHHGKNALNQLNNADGIDNGSQENNRRDCTETQAFCALCSPNSAINPTKAKLCADHAATQDFLAAAIYSEISRPRKVVLLHRCAGCLKCKSPSKFSVFHAVCKDCVREMEGKGKTARSNFISRTLANLQRNLQGAISNV